MTSLDLRDHTDKIITCLAVLTVCAQLATQSQSLHGDIHVVPELHFR